MQRNCPVFLYAIKADFPALFIWPNLKKRLKGLQKKLSELSFPVTPSTTADEHELVLFSRMGLFPEIIIPVIERESGDYIGVVHKERLFMRAVEVFHLSGDAMTLELEVPAFGLNVSEVIAVLEKNDATVLSFGSYHPSPEGRAGCSL